MKVKLNVYNLFLILLFLINIPVIGQFYSMGEHPSSTKWNQINTDKFQIIFDENAEKNAQKVANILDKVYKYVGQNLEGYPAKISIILQNHTTESNGFVTLAPKRSEFFTTAPQDNDVIDWLGLLAIHELRHVLQMDNLNQGITKILSILLGEQGRGLTFGLTVPLWFMEGDAVGTETALTSAGRGRLPSFEMPFRTQLLEYGPYSYQKASFGSYKNIVPNQYPFGYFMTTYVKKHYGNKVWGNVLTRVGRNPLLPFRFSTALKKETGLRTIDLYKKMTTELCVLWKEQENQLNYTNFNTISKSHKLPTDYHFPSIQDANKIIVVKSGFDQIPIFITIDSLGNEELIYQPINYNHVSFFANQQKMVWTETVPDLRWEYRNYSDIKIYDFETKKSYTFLKKTKLFAPVFSPSNQLLAAIDYNQVGDCQLVVYNLTVGKQHFFELVAGCNEQIKNPSWLNEDELIYVHFSEEGNSLKSVNIRSQKITTYISPRSIFMANPFVNGEDIFFESSFSGIDNIYAVNVNTKEILQVTSSKYGASQPSVYGDQLYYSNYTKEGYQLVKTRIDKSKWKPIHQIKNTSIHYYKPLVKQEGNLNLLRDIPTNYYKVKRYQKWKHLVNLHSWQPIVFNQTDDDKVVLGLELKSQNKLSSTILHYRYEDISTKNLKRHEFDITYNGLYPKITLTPFLYKYNDVQFSSGTYYEELILRGIQGVIKVPFRKIKNHFYHTYIPFLEISSINQEARTTENTNHFTYVSAEIGGQVFIYSPMNKRDIVNKWLFTSTLTYKKTLDKAFDENALYIQIGGNIPMFFKHHVLKTSVVYENFGNQNTILQNKIRMPRGYQNFIFSTTSQAIFVDYIFPLFYPDKGIDYLAYFQRIKTNLFFDYVQTNKLNYSYGVELKFDTNILRYSYVMDLGIRLSKPSNQNSLTIEPLFSLSF